MVFNTRQDASDWTVFPSPSWMNRSNGRFTIGVIGPDAFIDHNGGSVSGGGRKKQEGNWNGKHGVIMKDGRKEGQRRMLKVA